MQFAFAPLTDDREENQAHEGAAFIAFPAFDAGVSFCDGGTARTQGPDPPRVCRLARRYVAVRAVNPRFFLFYSRVVSQYRRFRSRRAGARKLSAGKAIFRTDFSASAATRRRLWHLLRCAAPKEYRCAAAAAVGAPETAPLKPRARKPAGCAPRLPIRRSFPRADKITRPARASEIKNVAVKALQARFPAPPRLSCIIPAG